MTLFRERDGDEWRCLNGHIDYGKGFVPMDLPEGRERHRQPSHGGSRL